MQNFFDVELTKFADQLAQLNTQTLARLCRYMKLRHGVVMTLTITEDPNYNESEKTGSLWMSSFDPTRKIQAIKLVREVSGLGLKEAKDMVELTPQTKQLIASNITQGKATDFIRQMQNAGMVVEFV